MTAAPNSPLVEKVAVAIHGRDDLGDRLHWGSPSPLGEKQRVHYRKLAQAALAACEVEAILETLKAAHAHVLELRDAWKRGAISEHDGKGGTRSNRNVDVEVQLREILAKFNPTPKLPTGLGFCPICGAVGIAREKRPDGNDLCEARHTYPSRDALLVRLDGKAAS